MSMRKKDPLNTSLSSVGSGGATFNAGDSLLQKLKQQEKLKEISSTDVAKYVIEPEGDFGQIQQISGGFGDSTNMDEDTIKALVK